ncbi:hypothetical protein ACQ7HM_03540 [Williamsia sp. MIQD14]|uniref:hypothetical protein n=1 Tax=Williamsia sp. MIQD14 TaxID=3425703 RepID=UPI003DA1042B
MASSVSGSKNRRSKGRHRVRTQSTAVTAAASAAMVAGLVSGGGTTAAAAPYQLLPQDCVAGSNEVKSNVDCSGSTAPVIGTLVEQLIPSQVAQVLDTLGIGVDSKAVVVGGNGTASIKGSGFTIAANTLSGGLLFPTGGAAKATAVDPFSGAVAVSTGSGNATSTGILGVAITAASSGQTADAFALGGLASAINVSVPLLSPVTNVSCLAVFGQASASGVGSCTSVLFIFTQRNAAGSPITYFSIADPTSFTLGDGVIPIPRFTRDLIRIGVGGPNGITVESGLAPQLGSGTLTPSLPGLPGFPGITGIPGLFGPTSRTIVPATMALGKTTITNLRTAKTSVEQSGSSVESQTDGPSTDDTTAPTDTGQVTPTPVAPAPVPPTPITPAPETGTIATPGTTQSTTGSHRKPDTDTSTGFTVTPPSTTGTTTAPSPSAAPGSGTTGASSTTADPAPEAPA